MNAEYSCVSITPLQSQFDQADTRKRRFSKLIFDTSQSWKEMRGTLSAQCHSDWTPRRSLRLFTAKGQPSRQAGDPSKNFANEISDSFILEESEHLRTRGIGLHILSDAPNLKNLDVGWPSDRHEAGESLSMDQCSAEIQERSNQLRTLVRLGSSPLLDSLTFE